MSIYTRLIEVEAKLNPPEPESVLFLHGNDKTPLEEYRRIHGKDPSKTITFRTIESDGYGGRRYCD